MAEANKKNALVQALAKFQADLPAISLDGKNPHFNSKFATLSNVTKEVLPLLAKNGFAFSVGSFVDNGQLVLDAHLIHESGESRSMQFPITENNPQKVGSAVTYYRRYALAALTGVVADSDDDGNAASTVSAAQRQVNKAKDPRPVPKPAEKAQAKDESPDVARLLGEIKAAVDSGTVTSDKANQTWNAQAKTFEKDGLPKRSVEVLEATKAALGI